MDGRSVRRLFAHRLWHNFQRSSGERRCPSPEFFFDFPPLVTGIILAVFTLLAITRGLHGVARLMQGFVPLMAIIWVLTSLVICVMNIGHFPTSFGLFLRVLLAGRKRQAARRDIP
ncbi:hypothetical protein AWF74_001565 [Escherichia coli]|nr:hypothetical protein AWF74_001565 [Escherichia coli]